MLEKEDLIEEIIWTLEDLLPYIHDNSETLNDIDYLFLICTLFPALEPASPAEIYSEILNKLYYAEIVQLWFITSDWIVNEGALKSAVNKAAKQLDIYEREESV